MRKLASLLCVLVCPAFGQTLKLDHLDRLAAKATQVVNVTLDGSLLKLASGFLSDDGDAEAAGVRKLVAGLKGIYIRSYEFKNTGEYLETDVDTIRTQLYEPDWKRVVQIRSKTDGDSDIYVRIGDAGKFDGLVVLSAEPKGLTIVRIEGVIDVDGLRKLSGNFGIPKSLGRKPAKNGEKAK